MGKLGKQGKSVPGAEGPLFRALDVDQLNRLAEVWRDSTPPDRLLNSRFLSAFAIYLVKHFRTEEQRLERLAAPDLAWHRREHRQLVRQIWELMNDESLGLDMTDGIHAFLESWRLHQEVSSRRKAVEASLGH